ncbi:MAG: flagellar biosynthetic protein FliQ [Clostridia bacterium]|nr:flagellar biosynthetic protein FliQ [Candidatus Gastranaerophilales bacterium]MBQ9795482.1 flagellar biosynthetic protein FliQ [Clostridia bacterium]
MEVLVEYMAKGFMVMLAISLPCVLVAAAVGLVVGILQAVTQVQEQTIAAAPKIVLVFLTIVILGGYFMKILSNFLFEGTNIAFNVVTKNDSFVLPSDYYKYTRPFSAEMQDKINTNSSMNKALINQGKIPWDKKATDRQIYINAKQTTSVAPNFLERMKIQKGN